MTEGDLERRARRLSAWYPRSWRQRFGDEFEQLLIDEMRERPRSIRRGWDVAGHGVWARLVQTAVVGRGFAPSSQAWIALRGLALICAAFAVVGTGMWSQLTVDWQWSARTSLMVCVVCGVVFCVSCRHFGAGWPGTGGHPWAGRGLVPGAVARPTWAATLWISAYWAHPGALRLFPTSEVVWMAASPLLIATWVAGALRAVRSLVLSMAALRGLAALGVAGVALAALFVAGAAGWVLSGTTGPHGLFGVGVIDDLGLFLLTVALGAAAHSARRAVALTLTSS